MCRKQIVQGACVVFFGLGLVTGRSMESWLLCWCLGLGLMALGWWLAGRK